MKPKKKNRILFIVATHGDEDFSIPVMERLENICPKDIYGYNWIVGNPEALKENKRFIDCDMNRSAPGKATSKLCEERRVHEITKLSSHYACIIDIHGTKSPCGIVTILPMPSPENIVLAMFVGSPQNFIWYSRLSTKQGSIAQHCECPALALECGNMKDPRIEKRLLTQLKSFLYKKAEGLTIEMLREVKNYQWFQIQGRIAKNKKLKELQEYNGYYSFLTKNSYKGKYCYKAVSINIETKLFHSDE